MVRMRDDGVHIARALTRLEDAVARRPDVGRSTATSTTTLVDGLRCTTREGDHAIETDLPTALGGSATGPSPSALLRAALGSCLAMGYRLRAARHRLPIGAISVEVVTVSAVGGMLDMQPRVRPGFLDICYRAEIESSATDGELELVFGEADRLSPVLDVICSANHVFDARHGRSWMPRGEQR